MVELGHVRPLAKTIVGRAPWPEQTVSQTFAEVATPLYQLRAVLVQGQEHGVEWLSSEQKKLQRMGSPTSALFLLNKGARVHVLLRVKSRRSSGGAEPATSTAASCAQTRAAHALAQL